MSGKNLSSFLSSVADLLRTIDLLQERRTALIPAAVTGQIDICGFAAKPRGAIARPSASSG